MHRFWNSVIEPIAACIQPRVIVEIGADHGRNTENILKYCKQFGAIAHIIDPLPKFDAEEWRERWGPALVFHRNLSLNALSNLGPVDLVLIDGDHNWFTVHAELTLLRRSALAQKRPFPIVLLHDVGWPYGRRDLYYNPDVIPAAHRQPYARRGLALGDAELVAEGGFNAHLNHSVYEHDLHNGVLTAVEDFIKEADDGLAFAIVPAFHGLGILYRPQDLAAPDEFAALIGQLPTEGASAEIARALERERLVAEIERQRLAKERRADEEKHCAQIALFEQQSAAEKAESGKAQDALKQARADIAKLMRAHGEERARSEARSADEIAKVRDELECAKSDAAAKERAERELQTRLEETRASADARQAEIAKLKADIAHRDAQAAKLTSELNHAKQIAAEKEKAKGALQARFDNACSELGALKRRAAAMEASFAWRVGRRLEKLREGAFDAKGWLRKRARNVWWLASLQLAKRLKQRRAMEADATLILKSWIFEPDWYRARYPDVFGAGFDLAMHYLEFGHREKRDPGPHFSAKWYRQRYPEIGEADPLLDYLREGARKGRDPNPNFSSAAYLQANPDVEKRGINPLTHNIRFGRADGRSIAPAGKQAAPLTQAAPANGKSISNGLDVAPMSALNAPKAAPPASGRKHALKVAVVAWDVGHNPLGRAYLIAEALTRRFEEVVLLGPQFPRFGQTIWEPLLDAPIPIVTFPGTQYPHFADDLKKIAQRLDCDAIVACKPRMPSMHLALLAKQFRERPLIVDIDDYEPSFCKHHSPLSFTSLKSQAAGPELSDPYSDTWTRYCETLVPHADAVLTSNETLREKFRGTIIPHARDEALFDPSRYDRETCRANLGVAPSDKVVLYAGTVRQHKGVTELAEALASLKRQDYKLCVLGTIPDRGLEARIQQLAGDKLIQIPNKPFHELPKYLMAADIVCVLQDKGSEISRYQLPAKIVDAFAMGVPILATDVPPLRRLIELGAVTPVTRETLAGALAAALDNSEQLRQLQRERRWMFEAEYSYAAISTKLEKVVLDALAKPRPLAPHALAFQEVLRADQESVQLHARTHAAKANGRDVVLFWKQHDTGVYGRRHDMLAKYFARHDEIRRVMVVEPPLPLGEFRRKGALGGVTEHQMVYREIAARLLGIRDRDKLSFHTFVYDAPRHNPPARWQYPKRDDYLPYVEELFRQHEVRPANSIFWLCPVNPLLPDIVRRFDPGFVVSDIIDDQRRRPGLDDKEIMKRTQNYKEVIELSDLVVTNNAGIRESMAPFARNEIRLLPNAAEIAPPDVRPEFNLARLLAIPKPRLGYVGNLESKIDVDLLAYIAKERPDWNIILIGSTHSRSDVLVLDSLPNVHFMGVVNYEEARCWMQHFDVALLPHLDTPLTRSMDPLKLFVYLGLKLPVVATRVTGVERFGDRVFISDTHFAFLRNVEKALRLDSKNGIEALSGHTWSARVEEALSWIRQEMAAGTFGTQAPDRNILHRRTI